MYMLRLFDQADPLNPIDARLIREGLLRIGRDPSADWAIPDPDCELSRAHCEIAATDNGLSVRCTGANGVFDEQSGERLPDEAAVPLTLPSTLRMGRYRLVASPALQGVASSGSENRTMVLTPPLGSSTDVPSEWCDGTTPVQAGAPSGSLLEAFCEGAGLDASSLSSEDPHELMNRVGALYRQMVLGIGDLMAERDHARAHHHLTRTTIGGANNNPFKWAPSQRLALDLLMSPATGFLSGPSALKASLRDVKRHLVASFAGLQASLRTAVESFDPAAIESALPARAGLLKSRAALCWSELERRHADLGAQLERGEEGSLDRAFVVAYDQAETRLGHSDT